MTFFLFKSKLRIHWPCFAATIIYALFLTYFYYTYVPLIPAFQLALGPLLLIILILGISKTEWSLLAFIFLFPLVNILPYLFGIFENIPHAPTALVLFLFFLLGWLLRQALFDRDKETIPHPLQPLIVFYAILILLSGLITFLRYGNFSPWLTNGWPELVVNADGVRAGGARMSVLFSSLNLISGLLFSLILFPHLKKKRFKSLALVALGLSFLLSLLFGLVQMAASSPLAQPQRWSQLKQFQSTYKDPNAFAFFLAAFFPLIIAAFLAKKNWRLPAIGLFGLSLACLLGSGARSALLASLVGIVFVLLASARQIKLSPRKKTLLVAGVALLIIGLFLSLALFSPFALSRRLNRSWLNLTSGFLNELFTGKLTLWTAATTMFRHYPLSGVGVGAFIVELPNYFIKQGLTPVPSDSAENALFQVLAELGIFGGVAAIALFLKFLKKARLSWQSTMSREEKILAAGISGGLVAGLVSFIFHSYIGSFEVKYLFWFLATWLLSSPAELPRSNGGPQKQRGWLGFSASAQYSALWKYGRVFWLALFFFLHLWNSLTSLSIPARTAEFAWEQDFGFYGWEKDSRGFDFRWAKKEAGLTVERLGARVVLPVLASHPDIEKKPVELRIYLADDWFKKKRMIYSWELRDKAWHHVELDLEKLFGNEAEKGEGTGSEARKAQPERPALDRVLAKATSAQIKGESERRVPRLNLRLVASRDWNPGRVLGIPDPRNIAFGLGRLAYFYPPPGPEQEVKIRKTIANSQWEGPQGATLAGNGSAELNFSVEEETCFLRLAVRGQKALGVGPLFEVRLDGQLVARTRLENEDWTYLYLPTPLRAGTHRLEVEFLNDLYAPSLGQDRNLFLGSVDLIRW